MAANMAQGNAADTDVGPENAFMKHRYLMGEIVEQKLDFDQKSSTDNLGALDHEYKEDFNKKFFYVSGVISMLRNDDKTYYLACPDDTCKKKVMEESVGWRCENCNKTYPNCVPTYVITAKIADVSE